jgi:hypothetical protein
LYTTELKVWDSVRTLGSVARGLCFLLLAMDEAVLSQLEIFLAMRQF